MGETMGVFRGAKGVAVLSLGLSVVVSSGGSASASGLSVSNWNKPFFAGRSFNALTMQAANILKSHELFQGFGKDSVEYAPKQALGDSVSTTVKFRQAYKGVEVLGSDALFHYSPTGELRGVTGEALTAAVNATPAFNEKTAVQIAGSRFSEKLILTEPVALKIWPNFQGSPRLVYRVRTKTTARQPGLEIYVDAHSGEVLHELNRVYAFMEERTHDHANGLPQPTVAPLAAVLDASTPFAGVGKPSPIKNSVYSANTKQGIEKRDENGFPTDIGLELYKKVMEDGLRSQESDVPSHNAYFNAREVYRYYKKVHGRLAFDGKDSRTVSVVHMGPAINAFWTTEYKFMAYGDGDGEYFADFTTGLDVTAHEMTHAVTDSSAELVYQAESGALNESYSDFFGKMVDYTENNWDIGRDVLLPKARQRAIRNMENPEEFRQPGDMESRYKASTTGPCNNRNDYCGVHKNSGIPNRAGALIVKGFRALHPENPLLGKEKAEKLYYNVLTQRLRATSDFKEARLRTEQACTEMFGAESKECQVVTIAYDIVKIPKTETTAPKFF